MLLRDDVLDVVGKLAVLLEKQAILAAMGSSPADEVPRRGIHG
jgi:hypothetical protein